MTSTTRRWWRWRAGAALIAVGLAAGCSVYQPLDQGSTVPWAAEPRGNGAAVAAVAGDTYRVRPGDRLGGLADRFGLSVAALAEANGLAPPYVIRVGQQLRVPGQAPGAGPREIMVAQGPQGGTTSVAAIDLAPPLPKRGVPEAGSRQESGPGGTQIAALDLNTLPARPPAAAAPPATAALPPSPKPEKPGAASGASAGEHYTVRSGETLSGIAERLDVGLSELAKANGIKPPYRVYAGQQLRVPGGGDAYRTTVVDLGNAETQPVRLATGKPPPLQGDDFLSRIRTLEASLAAQGDRHVRADLSMAPAGWHRHSSAARRSRACRPGRHRRVCRQRHPRLR